MDHKPNKVEALLWSIILPGFGQLLNGQITKGFVLVVLIMVVNYKSKLNVVILSSFNGDILKALSVTDYQWLMFYPCLYMFALWDAYKEAEGEVPILAYYPFVIAAYFLTVGLVFSSTLEIFGVLIGPIFLPVILAIIGVLVGFWLRRIALILNKKVNKE